MSKHREFSDAELAEAGRLTVDLFAERLEEGDRAEALRFLDRFKLELMTMYYSYVGWEKSILECIEEQGGPSGRDAAIVKVSDYKIAPERNVVVPGREKEWLAELEAVQALIESDVSESNANKDLAIVAAARVRAVREDGLQLHDGLMSRVAALLTMVYENYGDKVLEEVYGRIMKPESIDPDGKRPFREKVESLMLFTRCHLLPFRLYEDDEKVTFITDPCPSGARMIRAGHYEAPRNNAIVNQQGPLTYGRKSLPIYCCHEPVMERSSALRTGIPLFIIDAPEDVGFTPCKTYIYKNPAAIPEAYYQRLGLEKPEDLIASSTP